MYVSVLWRHSRVKTKLWRLINREPLIFLEVRFFSFGFFALGDSISLKNRKVISHTIRTLIRLSVQAAFSRFIKYTVNFSTHCSHNIIVLYSNLDFLLILFFLTGDMILLEIFWRQNLRIFPLLLTGVLKWYLHKIREYSKNEENMFAGDIYNI